MGLKTLKTALIAFFTLMPSWLLISYFLGVGDGTTGAVPAFAELFGIFIAFVFIQLYFILVGFGRIWKLCGFDVESKDFVERVIRERDEILKECEEKGEEPPKYFYTTIGKRRIRVDIGKYSGR